MTPEVKRTSASPIPAAKLLRHFATYEELRAEADNGQILGWVNELAELVEARRFSGLKYRTKLRVFREVAEKLLDKDELEEVERQAASRAAEETK